MKMDTLYQLDSMCCRELDKITERGELSPTTLDQAYKLVDVCKDVQELIGMQDEGNSQAGRWQAEGMYDHDGSYAGGRSGSHYVRGHYSRGGMMGNARASYAGGNSYGYDRAGGYPEENSYGYPQDRMWPVSREDGKAEMMKNMQRMMDEARSPEERESYRRALDDLRRA